MTQDGLGLGLAIVKYLVDAHGGRIAIESAGRGAGTTVVVSLPAAMCETAVGMQSAGVPGQH